MALVLPIVSIPFSHVTSSAQTLASPTSDDPKCPVATATLKFSASSIQTPAWVARQWLTKFRQEIPESTDSKLLAAVDAKAQIAWCVVRRDLSPATNGLGSIADAAVVIVTAAGTDEIALLDSVRINIAFPPSTAKGVDPLPDGTLYRSGVRIVVPILQTPPTDQALVDNLSADAFVDKNTILGIGLFAEDQPGRLRTERLVAADPCGIISLVIGIRNKVLEVLEDGKVEPSTCPDAPLRGLLLQKPTVSVVNNTLTLTSTTATVSLLASRPPPFRTLRITHYKRAKQSSARSVAAEFTTGGLRTTGVSGGCNTASVSIVFSADRFVIDPFRLSTAVFCPPSPRTVADLFLSNRTGTGTWARRANILTMRFPDGAVATMTLRRNSAPAL